MSDSPESFWPGSREFEAVVSRAVSDRLGPVQAQLTTVGRALAILAERIQKPQPPLEVSELTRRLDALASRLEEVAPPGTSLAIGERLDEVAGRVEAAASADTVRLFEKVEALEASVAVVVEGRQTQNDELRQALAVAVSHAIAKIDQAHRARADELVQAGTSSVEPAAARREGAASTDTTRILEALASLEAARTADAGRLLEQVATLAEAVAGDGAGRTGRSDELGAGLLDTVERVLGETEMARTADATRMLEQITALEGALTRNAVARQAQLDDLRHTVATTLDQAVGRIETARAADAATLSERIIALTEAVEAEAERRELQASAMLTTVDERLQVLHTAGAAAAAERDGQLVSRLESVSLEHGQALLARIDERTAAIDNLESIPVRVADEVQSATAAALTSQVEPLVARLVEAIDTLAHEGGRIEAMARGCAGEARAVEEGVASLFTELAERAETAVDRSRARISEGQVALGVKLDAAMDEMLRSVSAPAERLEARLAEIAESLRATGGHQNAALLDAVNRSSQQLSGSLTEVRAALFGTGTEAAARSAEADQRAESLAERLDSLRATLESIRHDPRLEALVVEQVAARDAQVTAMEAVSARIDEVGPAVARALLAEVERATRAANAAEEAVASMRPEVLRTALLEAAERAAGEVRAAAGRLDDATALLADRVGQGLSSMVDSQDGVRDALVGLQGTGDDPVGARVEQLDRSLVGALDALAVAIETSRTDLLALTSEAIDRSAAVADQVSQASGTAMDDLRASQAVLRAAVQDGAHKAELAAIDIRGLRERLTPHLVALAEATTRRAEADQAGFDAVLARLDQLLTASKR